MPDPLTPSCVPLPRPRYVHGSHTRSINASSQPPRHCLTCLADPALADSIHRPPPSHHRLQAGRGQAEARPARPRPLPASSESINLSIHQSINASGAMGSKWQQEEERIRAAAIAAAEGKARELDMTEVSD